MPQHNLKVLLHRALQQQQDLINHYGITIQLIAQHATPLTWKTLEATYSRTGFEHHQQHPFITKVLATHPDISIRLAIALHPQLAQHTDPNDPNKLITALRALHAQGHALLPSVHEFRTAPLNAPARPAPAKAPARKYELTEQQLDILKHEPTSSLAVIASAGAGKTSTLVEYAKAWPKHNFMYLAFNAAIKKEAESVMPRNVQVLTTHGLAYRTLQINSINRSNLLKPNLYRQDIRNAAKRLGIHDYVTTPLLRATNHALKRYLTSSSPTVQPEHLHGFKWPTLTHKAPKEALIVVKALIADLMDFTKGDRPFTHEMYLKLFTHTQSTPPPGVDALLVDEGQDMNEAFLHYLTRIRIPIILVGDTYQAIYGFRGAINAINRFEAPRKHLTRSWRFGQDIANIANRILAHTTQPPTYEIQGNPDRHTTIQAGTATKGLILARTNAQLFDYLINTTKRFYIEGGYDTFKAEINHAIKLYENDPDYTQGPLPYKKWPDLLTASEDEDPTANRLQSLLEERAPDELRKHLQRLDTLAVNNKKQAELHLSTAHKAKGLEAEHCTLLEDFNSLTQLNRNKAWLQEKDRWTPELQITHEQEIHLLYVAVTRATHHLYINNRQLYEELHEHHANKNAPQEVNADEHNPNHA